MRSGSNHSACASTKSMPCFALFAADFAASNSNRIWYRNYTTMAPPRCLGAGRSHSRQLKQTVYELGRDTGSMPAHVLRVELGFANDFVPDGRSQTATKQ